MFLALAATTLGCARADITTTPVQASAAYSHDPTAFTEGLLIHAGRLYESTGQYGQSRLQVTTLASGHPLASHPMPDTLFGEGLAQYQDRLYQLSWKTGVATVYNTDTLKPIRHFHYRGEGWGLAVCGNNLVMSNGSDTLAFRDPATFRVTHRLHVTLDGAPVTHLNELETIDGQIWANEWLTDRILIIDPAQGAVVHVLDASALAKRQPPKADVLNGIAYDGQSGAVYITGKYWPTLYRVAPETRQAIDPSTDRACRP